jgi:hypothetical protein
MKNTIFYLEEVDKLLTGKTNQSILMIGFNLLIGMQFAIYKNYQTSQIL